VLGLLLVGGALFSFRRQVNVAIDRAPPAPPPASPPSAPPPSEAKAFRDGTPMKRVVDLYASESRRVGQIDPDPKATEKRLEEDARELTPEEIRWLESQAADRKNDPDARFFAAYLMGLSHEEAAVDALGRIALSPVPKSKNERLVEQERAFRASAVEGISHSCKDFPVPVKDALLEVVSKQTDEFLRDRANRGLYACQTGKPIEEQDKEALEKLRKKAGR
jgi:hypothetical protein